MPLTNDEELLRNQVAGEIERLRAHKQVLQQEVDGLDAKLRGDLETHHATVTGLEKRRETLKAEVGQLVMDQTQWAKELQDAREAYRRESIRHDALRKATEDRQQQAKEAEALDVDVATRRAAVEDLTAQHVELVASVENAKGTLAAIAAAKREQEEVQQHLGQTMKDMAAQKRDLDAIAGKVAQEQEELARQGLLLRNRKAELDAREHQIGVALERLEAATAALQADQERLQKEREQAVGLQEGAQRAIDERGIKAEAHLKAAEQARQEALGQLRDARGAEEGVRAREAAVEAQEALLKRREAALEEQRQKLRAAGAELAARARASKLGVTVPTVEG